MSSPSPTALNSSETDSELRRGLSLFDSTMLVVGSMIGSGIFLVSAEMAQLLGSPGWLLMAWLLTGILTVGAALSYGELAGLFPKAGGQYVYLREAFSPLAGFLYGWTLFLVIQTGTIAAVAVAFARFTGVLWPAIAEDNYLVEPIALAGGYYLSLSTAQLVGLSLVALLTCTNLAGLSYGKWVQNCFTVVKTGALFALIVAGLASGFASGWTEVLQLNLQNFWTPHNPQLIRSDLFGAQVSALTVLGLFVALCLSQTGSLFSSDAWNNIAFASAEVRNPKRDVALAMALGTGLVIVLYLLANLAYLTTLSFEEIRTAPSARVGTLALTKLFPTFGAGLMAAAIMVSTFGCANGLILSGARAFYAMARDGLFFRSAAILNRAHVPAWALVLQGLWSGVLVLPRTWDGVTRTQTGAIQYGNLYGALLDYVISAALLFYILTILGLFRLRWTRPTSAGTERPYRAFGYPVVPALYVLVGSALVVVLGLFRWQTTWPGFVLVLLGVPVYFLAKHRSSGMAPPVPPVPPVPPTARPI